MTVAMFIDNPCASDVSLTLLRDRMEGHVDEDEVPEDDGDLVDFATDRLGWILYFADSGG